MEIKNNLQKGFSILVLFITFFSCTEDISQVPSNQNNWKVVVQTDSLCNVNGSSAVISGMVSELNADQILSRGFCWDTIPNPTIEKNISELGVGVGLYNHTIEDLLPEKLYYVRAFAKTDYMSFYGDEKSFTTLNGLPILDTLSIIDITQKSALAEVKLNGDGGFPITSMGVCWSLLENPTINDNKVMPDTIENSFTCKLVDLVYNSTYFVRAFATNSRGTAYGNLVEFNSAAGKPVVRTVSLADVQAKDAKVEGMIISDGGDKITSQGICWSVIQNPTINDSHIIKPIDQSIFTGFMTDLDFATTYYARAYAVNSFGIGYGDNIEFRTLNGFPILYIDEIIFHNDSALCKSHIYTNGGYNTTSHGICWGTSPSPTLDDNHITIDKADAYMYTIDLPDLVENTPYYIRAFATNSVGTGYSMNYYKYNGTYVVEPVAYILVEGGDFMMGSNSAGDDEKPIHQISVNSFKISKYEVTFEQYIEFLNSIKCYMDGYFLDNTYGLVPYIDLNNENCPIRHNTEFYFSGSDIAPSPNCPVVFVSWYGANAYCKWAEGRLPTEAEWEYAARGGDKSNQFIYSGSINLDEVAWNYNNSSGHVHPVGTKPANELGIYDMSGNAYEYCQDWWDPDYYAVSPQNNPLGPSDDDLIHKVLRSGCYNSPEINSCRVFARDATMPVSRSDNYGFRIVKDL